MSIQKILMTCARECHDGTGMFQGTDIEMYCPHVITDQILVACREICTQRKAAISLSAAFDLSAGSQETKRNKDSAVTSSLQNNVLLNISVTANLDLAATEVMQKPRSLSLILRGEGHMASLSHSLCH